MNANERRANERAADRLLKAAVRRAVEMYHEPYAMPGLTPLLQHFGVKGMAYRPTAADDVEVMLAEAARSADLLLSERAS